MFDRFTERARKVIILAKEEAKRFNHDYIGTEHLLLGIIKDGDDLTTKALANLGLDLEAVKKSIDDFVGRPGCDEGQSKSVDASSFLLTPRTVEAFEAASVEVQDMGAQLGDIEHLLLGILKDPECIATQVLATHQVNYGKFKALFVS